ncbi:chemotaxis protein CheX [Bacillus sp. CGMCC 1.16541]|uniref:chemotaxis protein CheX n=1 Tax=Bacillus sp. CGMCC 1.16541 TaxID=2185143 RepID=UPI000D72E254|nr:chemotaxis protein CheX [Bacillus sp. CGMCC 1.16541]
MNISDSLPQLLKQAILSFQTSMPVSMSIEPNTSLVDEFENSQRVSIQLIGDLQATLIIEGEEETFSKIAQLMFGMDLQKEMLSSFTCELGNMVAGSIATEATSYKLHVDITPPTLHLDVMVERNSSFTLPIKCEDSGYLHVALLPLSS